MGATNSFESEITRHIFLNEAIPNIGDAAGLLASAVDGDIYVALLSQDPGESGSITNEAAYTGYTRVSVARGSVEWSEANGFVQNVNAINFPEATAGNETLTHFAICKTSTGDDMILKGELPSPVVISPTTQPQFGPGQLGIQVS